MECVDREKRYLKWDWKTKDYKYLPNFGIWLYLFYLKIIVFIFYLFILLSTGGCNGYKLNNTYKF